MSKCMRATDLPCQRHPTDSLIPMNTQQPAEVLVPTEVRSLADYRMYIRCSDGVEGEIDIFPYLAESSWGLEEEKRLFEDKVAIAPW